MRRRVTAVVAGVLTAGALTALYVQDEAPRGAAATATPPLTTAKIARETLLDRESHDGTLGHGGTTKLTARGSGTITWLPATGATIRRGKALYRVDDRPVVLLYGSLPAYRTLSAGVEGADVEQFEKNLWALGYRGFTVDDEYTSATAGAVKEWQDDLGRRETGRVEVEQIAYASAAVRVDSLTAGKGDAVQPGREVLAYAGTALVATVDLSMDAQRLARRGAAVEVELPDGRTVPGRITAVGTTVQEGQGDQPDTTLIEVTISLGGRATGLDQATVSVGFTADRRANVLTVPVAALLALSEGGYGVQVVAGGGTRIVAVRTGLFADGKVEITGDGLQPGTIVGMPV